MIRVFRNIRYVICDTQEEKDSYIPKDGDIVVVKESDKEVVSLVPTITNDVGVVKPVVIDNIQTKEITTVVEGVPQAPIDTSNLATKMELNEHRTDENNPHRTSKEQVGIRMKNYVMDWNLEKKKTQLFDVGYFTKSPEVKITLSNSSQSPPYKQIVTKDGVTIVMPIIFTGQMTIEATEI